MQERRWTLLSILDETRVFFDSKGMDDARRHAELLLADVLGLRRLDLYLQFERVLETTEVDAYRAHVKQRAARVPVQYITGEAGFRDLVFELSREVLIPRPETEVVVEVALEHLAPRAAPMVLDLGCGAGVIAVSLAHERAEARVVATDISAAAVAVTRGNAERSGVSERLVYRCGDLFEPLEHELVGEGFDAIVSNPPYVSRSDIDGLEPEVRDYEPRLALDGGEDGLDFYRRIAAEAPAHLAPGGVLVLEVGDEQAASVGDLLRDVDCLGEHEIRLDLNRTPRVVVARKGMG